MMVVPDDEDDGNDNRFAIMGNTNKTRDSSFLSKVVGNGSGSVRSDHVHDTSSTAGDMAPIQEYWPEYEGQESSSKRDNNSEEGSIHSSSTQEWEDFLLEDSTTQEQLQDELERQIDEQLQEQFDQQLNDYFAKAWEAENKRLDQQRNLEELDFMLKRTGLEKVDVIQSPSTACAVSIMDIQAEIDKVVDKYRSIDLKDQTHDGG